jgi:6-carboxyhexanoate--CoA ligase
MRASTGGRHASGAERIVSSEKIDTTVQELIARARVRKSFPDQIVVKIETLGSTPPRTLAALDVVPLNVSDWKVGRIHAAQLLQLLGVSPHAINNAIHHLNAGAAPTGCNMRGAMIMDAQSGERLETDQERGIRASRFDWSEEAHEKIDHCLAAIGLTHFRTREALSLATKVAHGPGMIAELCWSDEPDYIAGYVASLRTGYVRFAELKQSGDTKGGRVFFVDRSTLDMSALTHYLQNDTVLISDIGVCTSAIDSEDYLNERSSKR